MSILIPIDDNDVTNCIELSTGQYYYDQPHGHIIDASSASVVYAGFQPFAINESWLNTFVVSPMTRVALYDTNQCIKSLEYTGNVLVISNYNNKKANRHLVNITSSEYADIFANNVVYVVIEAIDSQRCKQNAKRYADGVQTVLITSDNHKYKRIDEPIIKSKHSIFTYNPMIKLIEIIIILLFLTILFVYSFTYINKNGLPKFIIKDDKNDANSQL